MSSKTAIVLAPEAPPAKRRGAQPGNLNALKHGFYARHVLPDAASAELAATMHAGLMDEVQMLRGKMLAALAMAEEEDLTLDRQLTVLSALGAAAIRVSTLLKTDKLLNQQRGDDTAGKIADVLASVARELTCA